MTRFMIYAGEVASLLGKHPYQPRVDTFIQIFERTFGDISEYDFMDTSESSEDSYGSDSYGSDSYISDSDSYGGDSDIDVDSEDDSIDPKVLDEVLACATAMDRQLVLSRENVSSEGRSHAYKIIGQRDEKTAIEEYSKEVSEVCVDDGQVFHKRELYKDNTMCVMLGGRVDAFRPDGSPVEIKNRMRRFFKPSYDVLQLQTYMFILGKTRGYLVERLDGSIREHEISIQDFTLESRSLVDICKLMLAMSTSEELVHEFLTADDQKRWIEHALMR